MAHRSSASFRGRSQSLRRKTGWENGPGDISTPVQITSDTAFILGAGQVFLFDGDTVVRIRGSLLLALTTITADGDGYVGAVGIGIVSAPAFAVGASAVPTPVSESEWEGWMWHQMLNVVGQAGSSGIGPSFQRVEIDSKAMRKVGTEEVIYMAVELIETGTAVAEIVANTRMLVKLP